MDGYSRVFHAGFLRWARVSLCGFAGVAALTPAWVAAADVQRVVIEAEHGEGSDANNYGFQFRVYAEGLTGVELRLPGQTSPITWTSVVGGNFWEYEREEQVGQMTLADLQMLQASGANSMDYYRLTFLTASGSDTVNLLYTLPAEPSGYLRATSGNNQFDKPSFGIDPTGCTFDFLQMSINDPVWSPNNSIYKERRAAADVTGAFVWQPGPLSVNADYQLGLITYTSIVGNLGSVQAVTTSGDAFEYRPLFSHESNDVEFTTAVPEPGSLTFLAASTLGVLIRRKGKSERR
jgi:hypothetical protein